MNIHYKILFLYFGQCMPMAEIEMLLGSEIRRSAENKRIYHGKVIKDTPGEFIRRTIYIETDQIYKLKVADDPGLIAIRHGRKRAFKRDVV